MREGNIRDSFRFIAMTSFSTRSGSALGVWLHPCAFAGVELQQIGWIAVVVSAQRFADSAKIIRWIEGAGP